MHSGLWRGIRSGSPPAVLAGVRVSERRSRLLGLDAPTTSKTEVSGPWPGVDPREKAFAEAVARLDVTELEDVARRSQQLVDDVLARGRACRVAPSVPAPALPAAAANDVEGLRALPIVNSAPSDGATWPDAPTDASRSSGESTDRATSDVDRGPSDPLTRNAQLPNLD
jgi:hypothetical protein